MHPQSSVVTQLQPRLLADVLTPDCRRGGGGARLGYDDSYCCWLDSLSFGGKLNSLFCNIVNLFGGFVLFLF